MSFKLEADAFKTSPLKGAARNIHIILAHHADKDGYCYPKQETIAAEAGCSDRYVRKVLVQMVELGLIKIVQRPGRGNYHQYEVVSSKGNSSSGSKTPPKRNNSSSSERNNSSGSERNHSSGPERNYSSGSYKEPSEEPSEETSEEKNPSRLRRETDPNQGQDNGMGWIPDQAPGDNVHHIGDEAEDKPVRQRRKKPRYEEIDPDSSAMCRYVWHRGAMKIGHPAYSIRFLNGVIAGLHDGTEEKAFRSYSYPEIEILMNVFFARHGQDLRSDNRDLVRAFMYFLPRVQKEAKDSLRPTSPKPSQDPDATRAATMWAKYTSTERTAANA